MALQADDIADLVTGTLRELGRFKWTEIATDLQEYIALPQMLKKERVTFDSGYGIQWNVMLKHSGAAKMTGLYAVDNVNVSDVMTTATIPWRHTNTNYAIERREITMNRNPARIYNLVKVRRADAMISQAALMEEQFWGDPAATDEIFGIKYWIVRSATAGFNGQNPTNFSGGPGGIDASLTANKRWRNYTDRYVNISVADLVKKWRQAATKTMFMSPTPIPSYNTGNRYGYYTNYDVIGELESALEARNSNLGNDIATKDGRLVFRQVPVTWAPYLDDDTTDPVYGINWGVFKPTFLSGEYMNETTIGKGSNQHTVAQTHIDNTLNIECRDRRRLFVIDKA
jgi:hypothetical protein